MEIKKLKLDVLKYLRLRKIFRAIEAIVSLIIIVILLIIGEKVINIMACIGGILVIPESFLAITRYEIKMAINDENLIMKKELEFYSEMKIEFEKIRNEFISQGSKKFVSDECKELIWKEEMGIGWFSLKIKDSESKCNEASQIIEKLKSIKRLVIF